MPVGTTAQVYDRAGFGRPVQRGERPALIIVDFTYGFTDTRYPTAAEMSDEVTATARLVGAFRERGLPIVFTAIAYDAGQAASLAWLRKASGMADLRLGTRLVEIDDRLDRREGDHLVVKPGASAFFATDLGAYLASLRVDTLVVTGATTSGCVRATVVDAVQYGYPTLVPRDCVADRARGPHDASLFDINEKYGDVVDEHEVVEYLASLPTRPSVIG